LLLLFNKYPDEFSQDPVATAAAAADSKVDNTLK